MRKTQIQTSSMQKNSTQTSSTQKNSTKTRNDWCLAIDQGGHSTRGMVFDGCGQVIEQARCSVSVSQPQAGWVEQDPVALVASVETVITELEQKLGTASANIVAAGLATQRSNIVCWNKTTQQALSPAISWQDRRAHKWLESFHVHNEKIHQATGLLITAHYGASKLRWCLDNLSEVQDAMQNNELAWGPLASYLGNQLTLEHNNLVDPANASRTLLWDLKTKDWSDELLQLFGVPRSPLPRCVPTKYHFGHLNFNARKIPLRLMTGDQSAAIYAYGRPTPEYIYINLGTGAFIQQSTGDDVVYAPKLLSGIVYHDGKQSNYVLECTVNGAGSALTEIENKLGVACDYAEHEFSAWLDEVRHPPLFLNGVAGLGAPFWVPDFESRFIGTGNNKEKIVAVAESIIFLITVNIEEMSKITTQPSNIIATGGLASSDGLCQRLADLSGLSVCRPKVCEATARGTAYLTLGEPLGWDRNGINCSFQPKSNKPLHARYLQWHSAMQESIKKYK